MPILKDDQFIQIDPAQPPFAGTVITPVKLSVGDTNTDNFISALGADLIGGLKVTAVWLNDTVTLDMGQGPVSVVGVTFYREGGPAVFTPTDGTVLSQGTLVSCSYVMTSTQVSIASFGPPCFCAGTMIATPGGERPVQSLREGDLVMTRDHGAQPVRWIASRTVDGRGRFAPIRFAQGAMANVRALSVSPQHRILVTGWRAELFFGVPEILVAAKALVNGDTIVVAPAARVAYYHLLFDRHEIIYAEGLEAESLYPGPVLMEGDPELKEELLALFPELASADAHWPYAAPVVEGKEARLLG